MFSQPLLKNQSELLSLERVLEIYKEITGREEQWVLEHPDFVKMDEDELYEYFSNLEYTTKKSRVEIAASLKKSVLLTEDRVKTIYRQIMQQELEFPDVFMRMSEQELIEYLNRLKEVPTQIQALESRLENEYLRESEYTDQ